MEALKFVGTYAAALTIWLIGLAIGMAVVALFVSVGFDEFGLRGGAMLAFGLVGELVAVCIVIAGDNIAIEIVNRD